MNQSTDETKKNGGADGAGNGGNAGNGGGNDPVAREWASIVRSGSVRAVGDDGTIQSVSLIGQIEGHFTLPDNQKTTKYEHLVPLLISLEESEEVDGVLLVLHTMGGDVEAGLAIAELVASMKKPTVSLVLGGGHSIGVPLAVAAKRSFIVPSATMTIHPVRISGTVLGAPQTFRHFRDMQARITRFIVSHSGISEQKLTELMMRPDEMATDIGSIVEGAEAVGLGLIDEVGGLDAALHALRAQIRAQKAGAAGGTGAHSHAHRG